MQVASPEGEGEESPSRENTPSHRSLTLPPDRWGPSVNSKSRTSVSPPAFSGSLFGNKSLRILSSPKEPLTSLLAVGAPKGNTVKLPGHREKKLRVDQCYLPLEHIAYIKKIFEAYDFVKSGLSAKMDVEVRRQLLTEDPPCVKRDLLHRRRRGSRVSLAVVEKSDSDEEGKEASEGSEGFPNSFLTVDTRGPCILPDPPVRDEAYIMKRRRLLLFGMVKTRPGIDSEHREDGEGECLLPVTRERDSESDDETIEEPQLIPGGLPAAQRWYQKSHNIAMDHIKKNQAIVEDEIQRLEGWKIHQKMLRAEAKANLEINALANIAGLETPLPITLIPSSAGIPFTFFAQQIVARYFGSFFPMESGRKTFEPRRKQHVLAAKEIFRLMDTNADGLVSWDEFSSHVLQAGQRYILKAELRRAAEKVIAASSTASLLSTARRISASSEKEERDDADNKSTSRDGGNAAGTGKTRRESSVDNDRENQQTGESAVPEFGVEFKLGFTPEPTNCSIWQSTYPLVHHLYHQKSFSKMVISYRNRRYITAGTDGLVKLWKPDPRLLDAHRRMTVVHERNLLCTRCAITDLSLSPPSMGNAEVVAVSAMDGTITLLRTATGEVVRTLLGFRSKASNTSSVAVLNDLVSRGADREKKEFEANDLISLRNRQPVVSGSVIRMPYTIPAYHDDMMEIFFGKTNRYFQGLDVIAPTYTHLKRPVVSSSDILYEFGAEKLLKKLNCNRKIAEGTTTFCWYATALAISRCMPLGSSNCVLKDGGYLVLGFEAGVAQVYALNMNWFSVNQLSATRVEPPSGSKPVTSFLLHNGPVSQIIISDTSDLMISTGSDSTVQVRVFSRLTSPHIVLGEVIPNAALFVSAQKVLPQGGRKSKSSASLLEKTDEKVEKRKKQSTLSILPLNDRDLTNHSTRFSGESEELFAISSSSPDGPKTPLTATDSISSMQSSLFVEDKNEDSHSRASAKEESVISLVKSDGSEVGHTKRITCICYNETQHLIVSGAMDHCVIFWTSRSNRFLRRLDLRNLQYFTSSPSIGTSEDGIATEFGACGYPIDVSFMERNKDPLRLVVVDSRRVIRLLNAVNGNLLEAMMDNSPSSLALGDLLVARYEKNDDRLLLGGRCLRVWDIPRDEEYAQDYVGHKKPVIFMGQDNALRIFVTADEENIIMWNFTIVPHELALQRREDRRLRREQERMQAHQEAEKRKALRSARKARAEFLAAEEAERMKREKARVSATVKRRSVIYGVPLGRSRRSSRASSASSILYSESESNEEDPEESLDTAQIPYSTTNATRFLTVAEEKWGGKDRGGGKSPRHVVAEGSETENSEADEIHAIDARAYEDEIPVVEYVDANQFNLTYWRTNSRIVRSWKVQQGVRSVALETSTRAGGIYVALLRERSIVQYNSFNGAPLRKFLFPETVNDVYRVCAGETVLTQEDARGVTPLVCAAYEEDGSSGMASIYHLNHSNDDPDRAVKKELQERAELLARGVKLPKETRETGAIRSHRQLLLKGEPCTCVAILPSLGVLLMGGRHRLHYSPIMESTSFPLPCITLQDTLSREQERERRKSLRAFREHMASLSSSDHRSQTTGGGKGDAQAQPFSSSSACARTSGVPRPSGEEKPSLHLIALFPGRLVEDPIAVGRGLTPLPIHTIQSPSYRAFSPPPFSNLHTASSAASSPITPSPTAIDGEWSVDTVAALPGKGKDVIASTTRFSPRRGSQKWGGKAGGEDHTRKSELEETNRGGGGGGCRGSISSRTTARSAGNGSEQDAVTSMDHSISVSRSVSAALSAESEPLPLPPPAEAVEHGLPRGGVVEVATAMEERKTSKHAFYIDAQEEVLGYIGHIVPVRDLGYVFTGRNDGVLQLWNIRSSSEVMRCRVTLQIETITALSISCFGASRPDVGHSRLSALSEWDRCGNRASGECTASASHSLFSTPSRSRETSPRTPYTTSGVGEEHAGRAGPFGDGVESEAGGMGGSHHRRQNVLRDSYFVAVGDQSGYVVLLDFNALPWEEDAPLDVIPGIERRVVVLDRWRAHRQDVRGICFVGNPDVRGGDVVGMEYMNGSTQVFSNEDADAEKPDGNNVPFLSPTKQEENTSGGENAKANGGHSTLGTSAADEIHGTKRKISFLSSRPLSSSNGESPRNGEATEDNDDEGRRKGHDRLAVGSANRDATARAARLPITVVTTGEDTYTYVWVWETGTINCLGCFGGGVGNPVVPPLIQLPRRSMEVFEAARRLYVMHRLVRGFYCFQSRRVGEEVEMAVKRMEREALKLLEDDRVWQLAYGGNLAFLSPDQFPCYKQTFWSPPLRTTTAHRSAKKAEFKTDLSSTRSNRSNSSAPGDNDNDARGDHKGEERDAFSDVFDRAGLKGMRDRLYQCPSTVKHAMPFSSTGAIREVSGTISASSLVSPYSMSTSVRRDGGGSADSTQKVGNDNPVDGLHAGFLSKALGPLRDDASEAFAPYVFAFMRGSYEDHNVSECLFRVVTELRPEIKKFFKDQKRTRRQPSGLVGGVPLGSTSTGITAWHPHVDNVLSPFVDRKASSGNAVVGFIEKKWEGGDNPSGVSSLPSHGGITESPHGSILCLSDPVTRPTTGVQLCPSASASSTSLPPLESLPPSVSRDQLYPSPLQQESLLRPSAEIPASSGVFFSETSPKSLRSPLANSRAPTSARRSPFPSAFSSTFTSTHDSSQLSPLSSHQRNRRGTKVTGAALEPHGEGETWGKSNRASPDGHRSHHEWEDPSGTPVESGGSFASFISSPSNSPLSKPRRLSMTKKDSNNLSETELLGESHEMRGDHRFAKTMDCVAIETEDEGKGDASLRQERRRRENQTAEKKDHAKDEGGGEEMLGASDSGKKFSWSMTDDEKDGKDSILLRGTRGVPMYKVVYEQPALARKVFLHAEKEGDTKPAEEMEERSGDIEMAMEREIAKLPTIIAEEFRRRALQGISVKALSDRRLSSRDGYARGGKEMMSHPAGSGADGSGMEERSGGGAATGPGKGLENLEEAALLGESSATIVERAYISRRRKKALEQILSTPLSPSTSLVEEKEKKAQEMQLAIDAGLIVIETYNDFATTKTTNVLFDKEKVMLPPKKVSWTKVPEAFIQHAIPESFHIQQMGVNDFSSSSSGESSPMENVEETPPTAASPSPARVFSHHASHDSTETGEGKEEVVAVGSSKTATDAKAEKEREDTAVTLPTEEAEKRVGHEKGAVRKGSRRTSKKNRTGDWYVEREKMKSRRKFQNSLWSPARIVHTLMAWKAPIPVRLRSPTATAEDDAEEALKGIGKVSTSTLPVIPGRTERASSTPPAPPPVSSLMPSSGGSHRLSVASFRPSDAASVESSRGRTGSKTPIFFLSPEDANAGMGGPDHLSSCTALLAHDTPRIPEGGKGVAVHTADGAIPLPVVPPLPSLTPFPSPASVHLLLPHFLPEFLEPCGVKEELDEPAPSVSSAKAPAVRPSWSTSLSSVCPPMSADGGLSSTGVVTVGSASRKGRSRGSIPEGTSSPRASVLEEERKSFAVTPCGVDSFTTFPALPRGTSKGGQTPEGSTTRKKPPSLPPSPTPKGVERGFPSSRAVWDTALDYNEGKTNLNALVASEVLFLKRIAKKSIEDRERFFRRVKVSTLDSGQESGSGERNSGVWEETGKEGEEEDEEGRLRAKDSITSLPSIDKTVATSVASSAENQFSSPVKKLREYRFCRPLRERAKEK